MSWFDLEPPETSWLVEGLITSDGSAAVVGKPKAGKSTFVRNLVVSVITGGKFLDRSVDVQKEGRVLYVHLDRKDQHWRVSAELKRLGISKEQSDRLILKGAADIPPTYEDRLSWLKNEVIAASPHLVVIDLLWQFLATANGANDYNQTLGAINHLQDALNTVNYKGALVVTLHGRKANNVDDPSDDILGSTGQRGSFSTLIILSRRRREGIYTILSDQTERDEHYGEIEETILSRDAQGRLALEKPFSALKIEEKQTKDEASIRRILDYIELHPGSGMGDIVESLAMAKNTLLRLLQQCSGLWYSTGKGVKGDPLKLFRQTDTDAKAEAEELMYGTWKQSLFCMTRNDTGDKEATIDSPGQ